MSEPAKLDGMVPDHLQPRSARLLVEGLEVQADIGFHQFEIGAPQRLLVTVELWLEALEPPAGDDPALAWDYDFIRERVIAIAGARRFNLQETLAHEIYLAFASMNGVAALRVATAKPDVYPDTAGVGVEYASFSTALPRG